MISHCFWMNSNSCFATCDYTTRLPAKRHLKPVSNEGFSIRSIPFFLWVQTCSNPDLGILPASIVAFRRSFWSVCCVSGFQQDLRQLPHGRWAVGTRHGPERESNTAPGESRLTQNCGGTKYDQKRCPVFRRFLNQHPSEWICSSTSFPNGIVNSPNHRCQTTHLNSRISGSIPQWNSNHGG